MIALSTFGSGFVLGLSLIMAIGAQNAFVLKQGLLKQHVFWLALICASSDALLITLGVAGFGELIKHFPWIDSVARIGGAFFLAAYALKSLYSACFNHEGLKAAQSEAGSLRNAILTCLAFTWLNPHVYLDTLVLLGSLSTQYGDNAQWFGFGCVVASFFFFFSLGYGARFLSPLFAKPASWRVLDLLIALVMAMLAAQLIISAN